MFVRFRLVKGKEELLAPADVDNPDSSSEEDGNSSDNDLSLPGVFSHQLQTLGGSVGGERLARETSQGSLIKTGVDKSMSRHESSR